MVERRIECFLIEPTGFVRQELRRYSKASEDKCPGHYGYHNASHPFLVTQARMTQHGTVAVFPEELTPSHDDSRWPRVCAQCNGGYTFKESDHWQVFQELMYQRPGEGGSFSLREAPIGSLWDCPWYPTKGPDGKCISVKTPGGTWVPDLPKSDGLPWVRTGALPKVTIRPSIAFSNYHAFLTDGALELIA